MSKTNPTVDDVLVQDAIHDAVCAACDALDCAFPGKNQGGISDALAGKLHKTIEKWLLSEGLVSEEPFTEADRQEMARP